ncbi:MAG TPA: GNAT family N-acetyltransferase [Pseudonocardiaceae bacterium]|nr:GNAT family N-acetyltransferase [Pseudonocardiaceae bacterium]
MSVGRDSITTVVEIRDVQPGDARGIAAVQVRSWQIAYERLLPERVLANLSVVDRERTWSMILVDPPPRSAVLLVTFDAVVVGFVAVGPGRDCAAAAQAGELYAIYLRPDQWGRGIGAQLHRAAIHRLSTLGFTQATLWVLEGNERAIGFYQRNGWAADGVRRVDQGPGGVELCELRLGRTLSAD